MRRVNRQAAILVLVLPLLAGAGPRGPFAQQLARECDALISDAVRRPYGWGWDSTSALATPLNRNTPRHVMIEPPGTPGAALVLLWAGQMLDEPRFKQAAFEATRGIVASQLPVGKVPEHVIFNSAGTSPRDPTTQVPDRSGTRASLALLLTLMQVDPDHPDLIHRAAQRAAQWLVRQQIEDGAWPVAYSTPDNPRRINRIIRLDTNDYRDSTLVLLMAADAMNDPDVVKSANKAVARLMSLRIGHSKSADTSPAAADAEPRQDVPADSMGLAANNSLWNTAYRLNGTIDPKWTEFPEGADMLASRLALQTLIGAYLITGERQTGLAIDASMNAASRLVDPSGKWKRLYSSIPSTQPTEEDTSIFGPPTSQPTRITGTFELPQTLESAKQLKLVGQQRYRNMLAGQLGVHQQISATVCGLIDNPFTLEIPLTRDEVAPFLESHPTLFSDLKWDAPHDLSARVRRLWLLLLRTRLEIMQQP